MTHLDDDDSTSATGRADDEAALEQRAAAGDAQAFDLLFDRYFARLSWYFAVFPQRVAKPAVAEVLRELFGSLCEASERPLAQRAFLLARATELRHASTGKSDALPKPPSPAKVSRAKRHAPATTTSPSRAS
jgi:hypothetical protein